MSGTVKVRRPGLIRSNSPTKPHEPWRIRDSTGSTSARDLVFGHAGYTHLNSMLFNTSEIVTGFYAP